MNAKDRQEAYFKRLRLFLPNEDEALLYDHAAFMAFVRDWSPWKEEIDEEAYQTYALPCRVNDEPAVPCARLFFSCLKPLVEGVSLEEAIRLVNYWAGTQVTYRFNDGPTRDVHTIFKSGHGRCGEETVFHVLALRSVGIPARQAYVPRWSHCDDNHAWTEILCKGRWRFTGACEPVPLLDRGWFNEAASRAMLVVTRAYSESAPEDVLYQEGERLVLNVTERYAEITELTIKVERDGEAVPSIQVRLEIFNFGAFLPIAFLTLNERGEARVAVGKGTVFVSVASPKETVTACVDTRLESSVTLNLNKPAKDGLYRFVQQVPAGRAVAPLKYTEEQLRDKEAVKQAWKKRHPEPVPAWEYPPAREITGECSLSIETEEPQESLGIERLEENGFRRLDLRGRNILRLNLPRGRYRINLFIRLADGSAILSSTLCTLRNDKPLRLALEPPASTDESIDAPLPRELRHERAVLLFADSENEPLAHILQELSVLREFIEKSDIQIHIIKKETEPALFALGDGCFAALPGLKREYPLALAVKDGRCIYAFSGYNVGKARILLNKLWD